MKGIKGNYKYTNEQNDFIKQNAEKYTVNDLTKIFNHKFNTSFSSKSIYKKVIRMGLKCIIKHPMQGERHQYTDTEKKWLEENYDSYSNQELVVLFNCQFKCKVSARKLSEFCSQKLKKHKIINSGWAIKGQRARNLLPIGTERIQKDGTVLIKVTDIPYNESNIDNPQWTLNWMPKQRYIYEKHYGSIPENYFVIFLDGNKNNFELDNLYCVNRTIHFMMSKNGWYTTNKDNTLAALKYCELFYAIRN